MKSNQKKQIIVSAITFSFLSILLIYTNCGSKGGSTGTSFTQQAPFVSIWQTTTLNETITLPLREGFKYDMMVDWGDGSERDKVTSWDDADKSHVYAEAGNYTISIKGVAEAWYFNACGSTPDTGSEAKIIAVTDLGEMGWKNFKHAFCGCENLIAVKGGDTSNVTNMSGMFWGSYNAEPYVGEWDTSKVTDMSHLFDGVIFEDLEVSDWDTSKVTNMSNTFAGTSTNADLRTWDTSKVTNMEQIFLAANGNPDIRGWDTSKVTTMAQAFYLSGVNPNMENWNFAEIADMSQMLVGSQISNVNYTRLLKRIFETRTNNGVSLSATAQYYNSAATARTSLITESSWSITDGGAGGPDPG